MEITDQGLDFEADIRRRLEDQPRSRLEDSAWEDRSSRGPPGLFNSVECGLAGSVPPLRSHAERVVETRRLELLTLSLQRRCSAD